MVSISSGSLQQATPSSEGEVPDTTTSSAPDFSFGTCPTEQESGVQTSTLSQAGKMKDSNGKKEIGMNPKTNTIVSMLLVHLFLHHFGLVVMSPPCQLFQALVMTNRN